MLHHVRTVEELGLLVRAARKHQSLRMDDVAGMAGVGPVFVRELERGKQTVQLGRVLQLLAELGIELKADLPDDFAATVAKVRATGVKPLAPRRKAKATKDGQPQ